MAELLVRAGISQITLRDSSYVTRGLLVRQNFTELDVGRPKAEALAERLRQIDSSLDVSAVVGICQSAISESLKCDVVVDATVSTGVAAAIDSAQESGRLQVPLVQVATDTETAALGILTMCHPRSSCTTSDIDHAIHVRAESDPALAPFLGFWDQAATPPITPTLGCSVPTFRGSGADLTAIAATAVNLVALALSRSLSGGYLFASPHSPHGVPHLTGFADESLLGTSSSKDPGKSSLVEKNT
jgi:molybdopterin/thiamine biosynthesis adenylyltransferase